MPQPRTVDATFTIALTRPQLFIQFQNRDVRPPESKPQEEGNVTSRAGGAIAMASGAGGDMSLAINADGTIAAWGDVGVLGTTLAGTYTAVDAKENFAVALAKNGSIVAWGSDTYSQVTNVPAGTNFIQVVAGYTHAVALRSDR